MFHSDQNNIECVCVSPTASKEQIKFVYSVLKWLRTKILNENWRKKTKACLNLDHRKGDKLSYIQWWRFTFDKHFVPKLCRQKWNRSSEDSRRESFESSRVHWSQERRDKVREKYMYWRRNSQQQTSVVQMTSALCSDFRRWRSILNCFSIDEKCGDVCLRIACGLPNTSLTLKSKMSYNCCFEALNLTASHVSLSLVWQVSPKGISRGPLIG